ncbi:hypothetical protein ABFA07_021782 [Porites harrisoni]
MAEIPNRRAVPSGHDEQFVNPPDEDLHCIICFLPSKEPVLTRCGHRFCRECLEEYMRRQEQESHQLTCPSDREVLEPHKDIFPDKLAERKVLSHVIKCPSDSCEWTGELREKENHLASCPWKIVSCANENCGENVTRKDLTEHVANMCVWRILRCLHCAEHHPQCQMQAHLENCIGFLTACPNNCGIKIASYKVSDHVNNTCPLTEVLCPYNWLGCISKVQRKELESHLQCGTKNHLDLNCSKLNDTHGEVRKLEIEVGELQNKINSLENVIEEKVQALQNHFEDRLNLLSDQNNKLVKDVRYNRKALFFSFSVTIAIVAVILGVLNLERTVPYNLEANIKRTVKEQSNLEMKMDEAEERLEGKMTHLQSLLNSTLDEADKSLEEKVSCD